MMAWKRYHPERADALRMSEVAWLIERDRPSDDFLWPVELITEPDLAGHLMPHAPRATSPRATPRGEAHRCGGRVCWIAAFA